MNSQQMFYSYNDTEISQPNYQTEFYQNNENNIDQLDIYQTNYENNNQIEYYNTNNQIYNQYNENNIIYSENASNQLNNINLIYPEEKNNTSQQFNPNELIQNNENNDYQINNNFDYNVNLDSNLNTQNIESQTNIQFPNENNLILNNEIQTNEITFESNKNIKENPENNIQISNQLLNQNPLSFNEEVYNKNITNKIDNSLHKSELYDNNINNKEQLSSQISQLNNSDLNQFDTKKTEIKINSPKLINPLDYKISISKNERLENSEKEEKQSKHQQEKIFKIEEEVKEYNINLIEEEEVLRNNEEYQNKLFDFKSHFNLSLTKEENKFNYKKVHKVITPLLSHYEMPQNLEYNSPLLSQDEKFLACIGKGPIDWVFVWEISNLYWIKYKFSFSKVDCITFTPDSKYIIIVYKNSSPIMYDLSTGKIQLQFEKNGEEDNREGYQCSFTTNGTHFALTSTQSYTLWSLRNGKIKQKITDNSPLKIIKDGYLINIDSDLNCLIKKIFDQKILVSFKIKGISTPEEILDGRCTDDMANFVYAIKSGIVIYNFKDREYKGLQRFECGVERATFSFDGKYVMKTNMKNLCINDLESGKNILTILKENFKDYKIYFKSKKIITIDNISITIRDLFDENPQEKQVWLNKNATKFKEVKFNRDYSILFARVDFNNIIAYDLKTGYILKKWENIEENYIDYAITNYGRDRISTKSNLLLIKVWNFISQREEATFYGYNSNSLCFSGDGNYLVSGAKSGSEVARIYDIDKQKFSSYRFNGSNDNIKTIAHLTTPYPKRIICCSVNQKPLIFNSYSKELLYECECPIKFKEIFEIQSELRNNVFIIKGRDNERKNMGIIYKISDGSLLKIFENYTVLELVKTNGIFLIAKCENINGGKLCSIDYKNKEEIIFHDFQIQTNKCELLNDQETALIQYGDELNKEFNLINVKNGNFIGKINFEKNIDRNVETYLTVDPIKNEILFRYFELLSPEETMAYLKKKAFVVEGENSN